MPTPTAHPNANVTLPAIPPKRYFSIGEVAELCSLKPHVLRYWEQEFTQLRPMKRSGNRRYYQQHEVLLVRRIRELLYEQGFTISGARNRLIEKGPKAKLTAELVAQSDAASDLDHHSFKNDLFGQCTGAEPFGLRSTAGSAAVDDENSGAMTGAMYRDHLLIVRRELEAALDLLRPDAID